MSEILGVGLTHYPGLLVPPENWPRMLKRGVEIGRIPSELYSDHQRWPNRFFTAHGLFSLAHAHVAFRQSSLR